ncbi:hypothetical protein [Aureivirga sp. CE67]|uniref:hypothetical protein n=1 Tax=Aureivirga sp. CE67 TaxID=1788983 RepID=UPI0018C9F861|nr:hypothetical protein [Aureivirga sp. CE67]
MSNSKKKSMLLTLGIMLLLLLFVSFYGIYTVSKDKESQIEIVQLEEEKLSQKQHKINNEKKPSRQKIRTNNKINSTQNRTNSSNNKSSLSSKNMASENSPSEIKEKPEKQKVNDDVNDITNQILNNPSEDSDNENDIHEIQTEEVNFSGGSYSLKGRSLMSAGKEEAMCSDLVRGKVVLKITVDKLGKVINVLGDGQKGTTTNEQCLIDAAIKSAKNTKFNKGSYTQVGYITFIYKNKK